MRESVCMCVVCCVCGEREWCMSVCESGVLCECVRVCVCVCV